jgi:very-short-patch-repair endonuclease
MRKKTREEILIDFTKLHGDRYNYDNFIYKNYHNKSIIKCKIHGGFLQSAAKHIKGQGCKICSNSYSIEEVKIKILNLHKNYEFDFSGYVNTKSKILMKCKHGEKLIRVTQLLDGQACIYCKGKIWDENDLRNKLLTTHNNKYSYKDGFLNKENIIVSCKLHGDFTIRKDKHLLGYGCRKCSKKKKYDNNFFIECLKNKFNNYSFEKCNFIDFKNKVIITCNKHGDFSSKPEILLSGHGCNLCGIESKKYTNDEFLNICKLRYPEIDHSITEYKGINEYISATCDKHGIFKQKAGYYLNYSKGCPICKETKGEKTIRIFLEENFYKFNQQYPKYGFYFDFYLPEKNIFIEFDGKQHFEPIEYFGGLKKFEYQKHRDVLKEELLKVNNEKLIRIPYWNIKKINEILKKELANEN